MFVLFLAFFPPAQASSGSFPTPPHSSMNISRLPIFLALVLQTAAHGSVNLLTNPSAQGGATTGWSVVNGGDGWTTRPDSVDADGASFLTSYDWCTRSQTIDLLAAGYTP